MNINFKRLAFICAFSFLLFSCSTPLDKAYNQSTIAQDMKEIVDSKKVDTTDVQDIAVYMVRAKLIGEHLEGKTYYDILLAARKLKERQ